MNLWDLQPERAGRQKRLSSNVPDVTFLEQTFPNLPTTQTRV